MHTNVYTEPLPCTPESAWAYIADLRNDTQWRREVVDVRVVAGAPGGAGAVYEETIEWEGLKAAAILRVVEAQRASRLVIVGDGPGYSSRSTWTFEPHPGGVLASLVLALETSGALQLAEPLLWKMVSSWLERDLPMLQGHLSCSRV